MKFVFIMDPVSTVDAELDTTFALMEESERRGHAIHHGLVQNIGKDAGGVFAHASRAKCHRTASTPVELGALERLALADVDAVFIRKDPPFDASYLWLTLVLEHVRGGTLLVNDPRGLREANEKLYALHFDAYTPETLVSARRDEIVAFVDRVGGAAVVKPVDGHGGGNVFALRRGDDNLFALIEAATASGRHVTMVQRYLPEVRKGDKRILVLDGEPLGAINRVAPTDELRSNIHVGGRVEAAPVTAAERKMIEVMAPKLRADGLFFVGLDVIGDRLTEVNVTSPTGIQQMSRLDGVNRSATVIDWVEKRAQAF